MNIKKVLVVDDEIDILNSITAVLESDGYTVLTADNKEDGLKLAKAQSPKLAILDVMMGTHYEGFELAKQMTIDEECKNIKILMYTSIEVLTTSEASVREMAREFRQDPRYSELQVILVKDIVSDKAGIDYRTTDGNEIWIPVHGFLKKPMEPEDLLREIKMLFLK